MKNLFVGNMSFQTTETELRALFEPFGQVTRIHIVNDRETGQPRGFAQHEGQRRLVIVFVLWERGAAGNRRAVFDFQNQRLIPLPV